jgi:flagellar biogenesis protein FliO
VLNGNMTEQEQKAAEDSHSPRSVLIGLIVILLLVLGGLYLVYALRDASRLQDCVMQGRSNCSPIDSTPAGN